MRLEAGRCGQPLSRFGYDRSGTKTYRFSRLGYRSEELDPSAARRVFVCGASVAFGSGLDAHESWPARFREEYARLHAVDARAVNVLNFSSPLAPPDYVVRTLLLQASRIRPDVMIAEFSMFRRIEVVREGRFVPVDVPLGVRVHATRRTWRATAPRVTRVSAHDHFLAFLRGALLLQSFAEARGIACLLLWDRRPHEPYGALFAEPAFAPLLALLDRRSFCDFSVFDRDVFVDRSADGIHPGPMSSGIIANRVAEKYRGRVIVSAIPVGSEPGGRHGAQDGCPQRSESLQGPREPQLGALHHAASA
ncbi:MAG: hypothetical protein HYU41_26925 [Candidatus Rokubacteria bacterium]|nr:hypothetical protein [Candidatus Rokubacteria bacterium]